MHYFKHINDHVESNYFAFFVLVRGRQLGIYNQWREIVDQIANYPNSYY